MTELAQRRGRGRPPKYNWAKYWKIDPSTGQPQRNIAVQGRDFDTDPASFRALVHAHARNHPEGGPWKALTEIDKANGLVMFRFVPKED